MEIKINEFDQALLYAFDFYDKDDVEDQKMRRKLFKSVKDYMTFQSEVEGEHIKDALYREIFFEEFEHLDAEKIKDRSLYKKAYKLLDQYLIRIGEKEGKIRKKKTPRKAEKKCGYNQCLLLSMDEDYEKCDTCNYNAEVVEDKWDEKWKRRSDNIKRRIPGVLTDFQRTKANE